jgi:uncharacterized protein YprB with RNaseH-like and TPR domain
VSDEAASGSAGTAVGVDPGRGPADRAERIAQLRALIADVIAREPLPARSGANEVAREIAALPPRDRALLPGEVRDTEHGPLRLIERWLLPQHCHGRVAVAGALAADVAVLAQLAFDPALQAADLSRLLILDTETTGLSGGTGTVPFLIGLAFFESGVLKVEQLFLDELGGEAPMLHHLRQRLASASMVVSYNGKAFDWPLLRTRFLLNRVALPPLPPHLDLLHCARRLLRPRMDSVRLVDVERALLGFYREDDVDGSEIPALYLGYLRTRDPRDLLPVLTHNAHDVIALAALLERLCTRYASVQQSADPDEHLACARVALKARDLGRAQAFARAAADGGGDAVLSRAAHALCAQVAKKRGDTLDAASAWLRALELQASAANNAQVHLALARLYERDLRDLPRAYAHARWTWPAEDARAHGRRLGRLHRRLLRSSQRP